MFAWNDLELYSVQYVDILLLYFSLMLSDGVKELMQSYNRQYRNGITNDK